MSTRSEREAAKARIDEAFEQYRTRPRPAGLDPLGLAWRRGDEANDVFCALIGWLTGLVDSERPVTGERVAEAVEYAVARVLGQKDPTNTTETRP